MTYRCSNEIKKEKTIIKDKYVCRSHQDAYQVIGWCGSIQRLLPHKLL